jgi:transcriptional regulator with XRE-family HTH domain
MHGESLGARLRHHRERRGVSLKTIASQTKISLSLLEGLEKDDISRWPVGIFRRAYVRDYAHAIGLDPDNVVREFVERYPAPIEVPEPPPPSPTRLRSFVDTALASFLPSLPREGGGGATASAPARAAGTTGHRAATIDQPSAADQGSSPAEPRPPDLLAAARVCTELGRVEHSRQIPPLLREAAGILDAKGLIVWVWDTVLSELKPAVAVGYPSSVLSRLHGLPRDADNATAAAFRAAETRSIAGALVVPLLTPGSCAGVLAIELAAGAEATPAVRAIVTFLAATLAQLIGVTR